MAREHYGLVSPVSRAVEGPSIRTEVRSLGADKARKPMDSLTSAAELDLDIVGVLEGTDKSSSESFSWDYLRHYERIFAPWRGQAINLMEIGVERGRSLNVWRTYFPRATIVGIDINPDCARLAGDRVVIRTGSQEDPGFWYSVCKEYPPTIIIDDGSHLAHHIVWSFKHLFPMLTPGGLYVVEDLEFHSGRWGDRWAGNGSVSATDYILGLARDRMHNRLPGGEIWGEDRYIIDNIDAISIVGGAAAILKKRPRSLDRALNYAEHYLRSVRCSQEHYLRLTRYVLHHRGSLDHAEAFVQQAANLGDYNSEVLKAHVEVLCRQGRLPDAADVARRATRDRPSDAIAWDRLAHVERERGNLDQAVTALETAASLMPHNAYFHDQLSHLLQRQGDLARALDAAKKASELNPGHQPWQQRAIELAERGQK